MKNLTKTAALLGLLVAASSSALAIGPDGGAVVPEPGSLLVWSILALLGGLFAWHRHRRGH